MFAALDANGWVMIIGAVTLGAIQIIAAMRASVAAMRASAKTDTVAKALKDSNASTDMKLDDMAEVSQKTHALVNNAMSVQLKLNAVLARRVADSTKDPTDIKVAEMAEAVYTEHVAKQAKQ